MRATKPATTFDMDNSPLGGVLTAESKVSPFWGRIKAPSVRRAGLLSSVPGRQDLPLYCYGVLLAGSALALVVTLVASGYEIGSFRAVAVLALLAFYAEAQPVRVTEVVEFSVTSILVMFAAVLFGPLAAITVGAVGLLATLLQEDVEQPFSRWLVWTSGQVLIAAAAGFAVIAVGGPYSTNFGGLAASVAAASAAELLGDLGLTPVPAVIRGRGSWRDVIRVIFPTELSAWPVQVPLVGVLAYAYIHVSPWSLVLFVIPAFAAQRLYLLYRQQRIASEGLELANERLEAANLSFAAALVATLDARDRYTAGHSAAVAIYARDIARRMGLAIDEQMKAHVAGLVHDIGKVGLAAAVLEKSGPLSLEERRQMEQHSVIGETILSKVDNYADVAKIVRHHHERVDGFGYPDGLKGDEIPLVARIVAVADAYNAMTSDRPYRDAMPSRIARFRLAQAAESQFDTSVVAAFEAVLASASEDYRQGVGEGFVFGLQQAEAEPLSDVA
jgi:putative nucleotidyltransferase with HDIG domain